MKTDMTIDSVSFNKDVIAGMDENAFVAEYMDEKHKDMWPGNDKEARLRVAYARLVPAAEPIIAPEKKAGKDK